MLSRRERARVASCIKQRRKASKRSESRSILHFLINRQLFLDLLRPFFLLAKLSGGVRVVGYNRVVSVMVEGEGLLQVEAI